MKEIVVKFDWVLLKVFHLNVNSDVKSFLCNFADTIGWYYGNFPVNLAKFD